MAQALRVGAGDTGNVLGRDLGPSDWLEVSQDRVDSFAAVANDEHWIHNDPEVAGRGPFGRPIAHAHLTLALVPWFCRQLLVFDDGEASMFYGYNRVRLPAPVPVDGRIRMRGRVSQVEEVAGAVQLTMECVIEVEGEEKPACVAEAVWRHYSISAGG
jgi:acyl dehydratase